MYLSNSLVYHYNQFNHHQLCYTSMPIGEGGAPLDQPLSVAVNIEYTLDENKFVDLDSNEPALMIDPSFWKQKPVSTSTPKKKHHRNKLVRPHASLPSRCKPTSSRHKRMTDLLGGCNIYFLILTV